MPWKPGDPLRPRYVLAHDGLPARRQGIWAQDKLRFLEEYLPPAIKATRKKGANKHYVDLFSGPGRNAYVGDGGVTYDFPGSPILAMQAEFQHKGAPSPTRFNAFHFCNLDADDHAFLEARVQQEMAEHPGRFLPEQINNRRGDSNQLVHEILASIPTYAYLVVFADIEGPKNLPFSTLQTLKEQHGSVDLYVLFPTGIGLARLMDYAKRGRGYGDLLTSYFGTEDWAEIVERRKTDSQSKRMQNELLQLYIRQLRTLWQEVKPVRTVRKEKRRLYHMLFAYDHPAAGSIAASAARRGDQYGLLDGL